MATSADTPARTSSRTSTSKGTTTKRASSSSNKTNNKASANKKPSNSSSRSKNTSNKSGTRKTNTVKSANRKPNSNKRPNGNTKRKTSAKKKKKKKKSPVLSKIFTVIGIMLAVTLGALGFAFYHGYDEINQIVNVDTIYSNIFVNGVDISDLSKEEAVQKLTSSLKQPLVNSEILFKAPDLEQIYPLAAFGTTYDIDLAVETAYNYGREGNIFEKYEKIRDLKTDTFEIQVEATYNEETIANVMEQLAQKINKEPVNASLSRYNGQFDIFEEQKGQIMLMEETFLDTKNLLDKFEGGTVDVSIEFTEAQVKVAELMESQQLIGSFTTILTPGDEDRITNVKNALSKIHDSVLVPDEIFSINTVFGEMTIENGYRSAPIIANGTYVDDMGGGICQVSSTLYNAVLFAELEIVERRNHSLKVSYTDWGFDATNVEDVIDFRFKNTTGHMLYIEGVIEPEIDEEGEETGKELVIVNLYGYEEHPQSRTLDFYSKLVETIPQPESTVTVDNSLAVGARVVKSTGRAGYIYEVYKNVYENGEKVETIKVNSSTYRAVASVVSVGPDPVQETPVAPDTAEEKSEPVISTGENGLVIDTTEGLISTAQ